MYTEVLTAAPLNNRFSDTSQETVYCTDSIKNDLSIQQNCIINCVIKETHLFPGYVFVMYQTFLERKLGWVDESTNVGL